MNTRLNTHLLSSLPRILRMTHNEVSEAADISIACWYRIYKKPDRITIQQLISLANGLNVPVHKFFSEDDTDIIGVREDYVVLKNYQKCYYDSEALKNKLKDCNKTSWRKVAKIVDMHWTNVASSLLAIRRTPVVRILAICEAYDIDLSEVLIDPNMNNGSGQQDRNQDKLFKEMADLSKKIDDLDSVVQDLTDKFRILLDRHNRLENTVDTFSGFGFTGMVAESEEK